MTPKTPAEQHLEVIEDAERILEDYHRTAPIETFSASHADRRPTELADQRGARLVTANETDEGRRWAESRINMLTGGDPVRARFMRQDLFEFTPQVKLLSSGNHKPSLRSSHHNAVHRSAPTTMSGASRCTASSWCMPRRSTQEHGA